MNSKLAVFCNLHPMNTKMWNLPFSRDFIFIFLFCFIRDLGKQKFRTGLRNYKETGQFKMSLKRLHLTREEDQLMASARRAGQRFQKKQRKRRL